MAAEIVGNERAEQRVIAVLVSLPAPLQEMKAGFRIRGRQLEVVSRHVAIGTRAAIAREAVQPAIQERKEAAKHGLTGFSAAIRVFASGQGRRAQREQQRIQHDFHERSPVLDSGSSLVRRRDPKSPRPGDEKL
jgi:hypothetical protein